MRDAIAEICQKYTPNRIIIETSGSAFPAPIALQIREMTKAKEGVYLDSIVTVIDCENFQGYEDTSYTAKIQAQFTDIILMNKHEQLTEQQYDIVCDHVCALNDETPIMKTFAGGNSQSVHPDLVFGLDTSQFSNGPTPLLSHAHDHHAMDVDLLELRGNHGCARRALDYVLGKLPKDEFYRIKGFVRLDTNELYVLNYAFGRWEYTPIDNIESPAIRLTAVLESGSGKRWANALPLQWGKEGVDIEARKL